LFFLSSGFFSVFLSSLVIFCHLFILAFPLSESKSKSKSKCIDHLLRHVVNPIPFDVHPISFFIPFTNPIHQISPILVRFFSVPISLTRLLLSVLCTTCVCMKEMLSCKMLLHLCDFELRSGTCDVDGRQIPSQIHELPLQPRNTETVEYH